MKTLILVALILGSVGCGKAPALGGGGPVTFSVVDPISGASPSPSPSASPASYTVLKNWGSMNEEMPLDFSSFTIGVKTGYILWYQYNAGQFGVNGQEYRSCRAKFELDGTPDSGTLTVSQSEIAWSIDPSESITFTPCPTNLDGTYSYSVDANGMTMNGVLYQ